MNSQDYQKLKTSIRINDTARGYAKQKELLQVAEERCTPQQKAAITRMLAQREADWELAEMRGDY